MTTQLEDELRSALMHKVSEIPISKVLRLSSTDYHPRTHSAQRRLALGTVGAVSVALVASLVVGNVAPGKQNDAAAWSATPTTPAPGQVAAARAECLRTLTLGNQPVRKWQQIFTTTRGAFTMVGYKATNTEALNVNVCLTDGSPDTEGTMTGIGPTNINPSGFGPSSPVNLDANTIRAEGGGTGGQYSIAIGEAGSQVTGVTFVMELGTRTITIPATVAHGIYALWWPGNMLTRSVHVTTAQGTTDGSFSPTDGTFVPGS